jgi:hypothetical protein
MQLICDAHCYGMLGHCRRAIDLILSSNNGHQLVTFDVISSMFMPVHLPNNTVLRQPSLAVRRAAIMAASATGASSSSVGGSSDDKVNSVAYEQQQQQRRVADERERRENELQYGVLGSLEVSEHDNSGIPIHGRQFLDIFRHLLTIAIDSTNNTSTNTKRKIPLVFAVKEQGLDVPRRMSLLVLAMKLSSPSLAISCVRVILDLHQPDVNTPQYYNDNTNRDGRSPLWYACTLSYPHIAHMLIDSGARPSLPVANEIIAATAADHTNLVIRLISLLPPLSSSSRLSLACTSKEEREYRDKGAHISCAVCPETWDISPTEDHIFKSISTKSEHYAPQPQATPPPPPSEVAVSGSGNGNGNDEKEKKDANGREEKHSNNTDDGDSNGKNEGGDEGSIVTIHQLRRRRANSKTGRRRRRLQQVTIKRKTKTKSRPLSDTRVASHLSRQSGRYVHMWTSDFSTHDLASLKGAALLATKEARRQTIPKLPSRVNGSHPNGNGHSMGLGESHSENKRSYQFGGIDSGVPIESDKNDDDNDVYEWIWPSTLLMAAIESGACHTAAWWLTGGRHVVDPSSLLVSSLSTTSSSSSSSSSNDVKRNGDTHIDDVLNHDKLLWVPSPSLLASLRFDVNRYFPSSLVHRCVFRSLSLWISPALTQNTWRLTQEWSAERALSRRAERIIDSQVTPIIPDLRLWLPFCDNLTLVPDEEALWPTRAAAIACMVPFFLLLICSMVSQTV